MRTTNGTPCRVQTHARENVVVERVRIWDCKPRSSFLHCAWASAVDREDKWVWTMAAFSKGLTVSELQESQALCPGTNMSSVAVVHLERDPIAMYESNGECERRHAACCSLQVVERCRTLHLGNGECGGLHVIDAAV